MSPKIHCPTCGMSTLFMFDDPSLWPPSRYSCGCGAELKVVRMGDSIIALPAAPPDKPKAELPPDDQLSLL